jgi:uncharacterized glyoxalase superfamily metalloenzyme YdcJ
MAQRRKMAARRSRNGSVREDGRMRQAWELRAEFAKLLSDLYGREVPAYTTLVDVAHQVNRDVAANLGSAAERLGSIDRVTAERHGAIRVGTPAELAQLARIFGAMGMYPTGFYDLREASTEAAVPVVSTAFRPTDPVELARNPFRVFTSLLATQDRRFFSADLAARLEAFLARRQLFAPRLLELADRAEADGGLAPAAADEFLGLATASFALSAAPVERAWYDELSQVSEVAADIGGVGSTHINHLTPRVLDIDALYARMAGLGIEMIDKIQGPPRWAGPDVLLRQTSFKALAEPRRFIEADGSLATGSLRVRFGEVEARGIALTRRGREVYDEQGVAGLPATEHGLAAERLGVFTFTAVPDRARDGRAPTADLPTLLADGWLRAEPVVYEDFLPRSAAGIFRSNLTSDGSRDIPAGRAARDAAQPGADLDADWLAGVLQRPLSDPHDLYETRAAAAERSALAVLNLRSLP